MYFLPLSCVQDWNAGPDEKAALCLLWADYLRRVHLGQAMDIAWHRQDLTQPGSTDAPLPGLDDYDQMCRLKTGGLARLAAVLGVRAAHGSTAAEQSLGEAAESLGLGFQILDDVKNLEGGVKGKKRGDDIIEGKLSLPMLLYLHRRPEKRQWVGACFKAARETGLAAPEVEELIAALEAAGVLAEAKTQALETIAGARRIFESPPLNAEGRRLLGGLIDFIS
jgi:octaprenyl-diphosphate synthase